MDKSNNLVCVVKYVAMILFQNWLVLSHQSSNLIVKGDKWAH